MRKLLVAIEMANYRIDDFIENNWVLFLAMVAILTVAFVFGIDATMAGDYA